MPNTGGKPNCKRRQIYGNPLADGISEMFSGKFVHLQHGFGHGNGVENIVGKPGSHGNVPTVPVLFDVFGKIRPPEVFCDRNAHTLGNTDGDIDTAGKVCVQLKRLIEHAYQNPAAGISAGVVYDYLNCRQESVCNDHFFEKSP